MYHHLSYQDSIFQMFKMVSTMQLSHSLCNLFIWNKQCFAIKHSALLIVVIVRFYSSIIKRLSYFLKQLNAADLNITHTGGNGAFVGDYFYPWITSNLVLWWDSVCGIESKTTTVCVLMVMNVSQCSSVTHRYFFIKWISMAQSKRYSTLWYTHILRVSS